MPWIDAGTGRRYDKGFYDENGQYYESVAYAKNGVYTNVICQCPYCDHRSVISLSTTEANDRNLKCPNCGGAMEIRSALDEYQSFDSSYSAPVRTRSSRSGLLVLIVMAVIFITAGALVVLSRNLLRPEHYSISQGSYVELPSSDAPFGYTVTLGRSGNDSYSITDGGTDKTLIWDADYESYYDKDSDCYLWYNTDVEPPLWQYWYEGISSDFGDYGWMEHDDEGWWIEADENDWIPLPDEYDTVGLWYIDN